MNSTTILLVEDDDNLGYILSEYLEMNGYKVLRAGNGVEGLTILQSQQVALCLLDVMMPEMDGFEMASRARDAGIQTPVIFLTARSLKIDKLKGFNHGADDYMTKPIEEEEMLARIKAVLRRTQINNDIQTKKSDLEIGKYTYNRSTRILRIEDQVVTISEKESQLLELLVQNRNRLTVRADALKKIWGANDYFTRKSMDVHIHKLRKLLKHDAQISINNIHGKGFILTTE